MTISVWSLGVSGWACQRALSVLMHWWAITLKAVASFNVVANWSITKVTILSYNLFKLQSIVKKSDVWKPTKSMYTFLLVFSSPLCFHYVSISTNSTEVEAVNITLVCTTWRVNFNCRLHWVHRSSEGWLIFQIKCVEAERTRALIAFKILESLFSLHV